MTNLDRSRPVTPFRPLLAFLCLLCLAFHIPLQAQSPASSADVPPPLSVRFMAWESAIANLLLRDARGEFVPVTIPAYNWGPIYEVPATGDSLVLYREVEKDGVKTHQIVAQARLEPGCREFQVALVRQSGEQPYRMIALPRDLHVFGAGVVRVFNFSPHPIAVRLGDQEVRLGPLEWRLVTVSPDNKYRVVMLSAIQIDGTWVGGGNRVISLRPDHRGDLMIVHSGTRIGLAPGVASDTADLTQTLIETEYISPRMRRLAGGQ